MDSRAQFEEWFYSEYKDLHTKLVIEFAKSIAWEGWKASRAAIEIDFPDYTDETDSELSCFDGEYEWGNRAGATYAVEQCAKRIRIAGIRIKG